MKTYIGVKLIDAQPMDRGEYNKYRGWTIPPDEDPEEMGWLVRYPDGYESWSPAKAFSEAYREVTGGCMSFGLAIEAMKKGEKVARQGWNGKDMWIAIAFFGEARDEPTQFIHFKGYADPLLLNYITMKTVQGKFVPWLASQTDMLSDDWFIVE